MRNLAKHLTNSSGFDLKHILVEPGKTISSKKAFDPASTGNYKDKEDTLTELKPNIEQLVRLAVGRRRCGESKMTGFRQRSRTEKDESLPTAA